MTHTTRRAVARKSRRHSAVSLKGRFNERHLIESLEQRVLLSASDDLFVAASQFVQILGGGFVDAKADDGVGASGGGVAASGKTGGGSTRDDYGNTLTAASAISLDASGAATVSGKIDAAGDVDVLRFTATVTGTMQITLTASGGKTVISPSLVVYDAAGTRLAPATGTNAASASINVTAGLVYYAQASSLTSSTGGYSLTISTAAVHPDIVPPTYLPAAADYLAGTTVAGQVVTTANGPVLVITGTDAADTVTVTQDSSGNLLLTTAAGTQTFTGAFSGLAIYGFAGADTLRIANSVTSSAVIYAGGEADTIYEAGAATSWTYGDDGNDQVITVGGQADILYGGLGTDTFWTDSTDYIVDTEAAETAGKTVHKIAQFVQPTSVSTSRPSLEIAGQDLVDPVAGYAYTNTFVTKPLWVDGPQYNDIRQGAVGDCYYLASLSAMSDTDPAAVQQAITALGDGTYAVRFYSGSTETYYRIDAQLPTSGSSPAYAKLSRSGEIWVALMEKAFAQFRYGQNSYSSINGGWMSEGYAAVMGAGYTSMSTTSTTADALAQSLANQLAAGHAVTAATPSTSASSYIIGNHAYNVHQVTYENGQWYVTVYNPWGYDGGAAFDTNSGDGLLMLTATQFQSWYTTVQVSKG